jgi:hypothetical protein
MAKWIWSKEKELAAQLVSEDELSTYEISKQVGVTTNKILLWKRSNEFKERVEQIVQSMGRPILKRAIARKASRIRFLDDRVKALMKIVEERGMSKEMQTVPGGTTGYLVGRMKHGKMEYEIDFALLKELREHEKQAAMEMGDWHERVEFTNRNEPQVITEDERIAIMSAIMARVSPKLIEDRSGDLS